MSFFTILAGPLGNRRLKRDLDHVAEGCLPLLRRAPLSCEEMVADGEEGKRLTAEF